VIRKISYVGSRDPQCPLCVDSSRPLGADIVEKAVKYFGNGCSREFDGAELMLIAPQLCARRPNLSF
jgi:hypothetical protein